MPLLADETIAGGFVTFVAVISAAITHLVHRGVETISRLRAVRSKKTIQQHEMTVSLRVSNEYERIITRLQERLDKLTDEFHQLMTDRRKERQEWQNRFEQLQKHADQCDTENRELRIKVVEMESKLAVLTSVTPTAQ
jgi:chromosome segregation ATPase